jgi:RNA polymerase sigma-70 factor, ECF subfamily
MSAERHRIPLHIVPDSAPPQPDDAQLARALIAGQAWAYATTWNRFAPMVFRMASHALGNGDEAEDVTQEVFFRLFARAKTLNKPESLRSFVTSFAIRILKWELRSKRARSWLSFYQPKDVPETPYLGFDPEARDVLRRFYTMLGRLKPRERIVFCLRHLDGQTLDEIADAMELSLSTVKRSHERASTRVSQWVASDTSLAVFLKDRHDKAPKDNRDHKDIRDDRYDHGS